MNIMQVTGSLIIEQGLVLTVVGMAITFIFLYLLVLIIRIIAKIVPRYEHLFSTTDVKKK